MKKEKIRISIVNYTNTLPFKWALKRSPLLAEMDLQEDIPSICAQKLKFGQVDLALVPVALLAELDNYNIESDYCIGANGRVDSVKLYSHVPLKEIKSVTLDYQSKSSITLTKILFRFFWKHDVVFTEAKPGFEDKIEGSNAAVVIGDRTFGMNGQFAFEYDLAEEWQKFTGLPFVFAAWVSTHKVSGTFIKAFNDTLKLGVENIDKAIEEDYSGTIYSARQTQEYLSIRIDYHLDDNKNKAMKLFLDYIQKLNF
ncbi:MAG: menaquinone biosynthesis protein [Bacteroidia bacterium]|nr:menaquinone biosynthesis protein [Bacteroidia bacterium]